MGRKKKYYTEEERKKAYRLASNKYRNAHPEYDKERKKEYDKQYRESNPDKIKETHKNHRERNRTNINERDKKWQKQYRDINPQISAWRHLLYDSLKRMGKNKEGHTIDLLGYSALDLKNHIQNIFTDGMSWDNYGEWHIDHIKRVCEFDKDTHPSIVNALPNLRPLWATTREINGVVYEGNLNRG